MKTLVLSNAACMALGILPTHDMPQLHGQVCLANDSLIEQATYVEEVTTFGIGYSDPNRNRLAQLLNFLAPERTSGRNALVTQFDEAEPFEVIRPEKVKRNPGHEFPEVKQRKSTKVARLIPNRGLTVRLDKDQLKDKPNWQQMHAAWLIDLLYRASIIEAIEMHEGIATADNMVWNNASNPDLMLRDAMINDIAPIIGFKPNRAVYGEAAALLRQQAYEAQDKAGAVARASMLTDQQLATALGIDRVLTNAERYNNDSGVRQTFLGSKVLLFTGVDGESPEDPSNVVRHVATASFGDGKYAVYIHEQGVKTVFITVENYELPVVQHTGGVALYSVADA